MYARNDVQWKQSELAYEDSQLAHCSDHRLAPEPPEMRQHVDAYGGGVGHQVSCVETFYLLLQSRQDTRLGTRRLPAKRMAATTPCVASVLKLH
mmetsp:Transcript_2576/g.4415  ORF Transcript_2576/g.4415 Transcript_2576/m.4415 type:complete len:94 (-) Transcript_2576:41-322(-)